jgi:hypothetical protein
MLAMARAENSDVKVLGKSDFKSTIEKEDLILVEVCITRRANDN